MARRRNADRRRKALLVAGAAAGFAGAAVAVGAARRRAGATEAWGPGRRPIDGRAPDDAAPERWTCACGTEFRVSGAGRHQVFWLADAPESDPVLGDRCPSCDRPLGDQEGGDGDAGVTSDTTAAAAADGGGSPPAGR